MEEEEEEEEEGGKVALDQCHPAAIRCHLIGRVRDARDETAGDVLLLHLLWPLNAIMLMY